MVRVVRRVDQGAQAALRQHGLTPSQYQLMRRLRTHPGRAQHQLADDFCVTRGNISQLVKRLESAGLVYRHRVSGSEYLELTTAGSGLVERLIPEQEAFMRAQFASLDSGERQRLGELLGKLGA